MEDDFDRARKLYDWDKRVLSILGVWPLKKDYLRFSILIIYITIHVSTELADLYNVFGDLDLMILNLSESSWEVMIMAKLIVIRFSKTLEKIFVKVLNGVKSELYEGPEERENYLGYNRMAKMFFKACLICNVSTSVFYHMRPLEFRLRAVLSNESMPFILPYRTQLFFDVNDSSTFWFVWIYQTPMMLIHPCHGACIGILFSLVLHVCGRMSVLAIRIRNLDIDLRTDPRHAKDVFRDLVKKHLKIVWMAKAIDDTFRLLLLEELFVMTMVICLTAYSVLLNSATVQMANIISFFMFVTTTLMLFCVYCVAGEFLIIESANVCEAYYECRWYDLSSSSKKQLIICMAATRKPLQLTAGGYYIFSLESYSSILKTAMGYISVLRTII